MQETLKAYAASSLRKARDDNCGSIPCAKTRATSGMSLNHPHSFRNLFTVQSNLPVERVRPKVIWHDVVSKSLSNYPTNGTPAKNEQKFIDSVVYLTELYNMEAWIIINRNGQITIIEEKKRSLI